MLRLHLLGGHFASHHPALVAAEGAGLGDLDQVANVHSIVGVVSFKFGGDFVLFAVDRMLFDRADGYHDGLVHFVGDDCPPECADHWVASFLAISRSRWMVRARAMVFL